MAITKSARAATAARGPDRLTVVLLALAGFLVVLALLAWQLRSTSARAASRPVIVLRRVYRTTVVETIAGPPGSRGKTGTSVTQSGSSSGLAYTPAARPTTRSS